METEYIPADPKEKERLDNLPSLDFDFREFENDKPYEMTDPVKI